MDRTADTPSRDEREIRAWLRRRVAEELGIRPDQIELDKSHISYGLGSVTAVALTGELMECFELSLPRTLFYDEPTLAAVARRVARGDEADDQSLGSDAGASGVPKLGPIAIVGMACRFPGADNLQELWRVLIEGRDCIREVPSDRWCADELYDPDPAVPGKMTSRWGGFLERIAEFDAEFFGISQREAEAMDPQQRWLLELAWEALEDSGQRPAELAGRPVGVFVGLSTVEYGAAQLQQLEQINAYSASGSAAAIAANRISYSFDLCGPSMTVDTACSSSLTAVHLACQSLQLGESEQALVGGASLILSPAIGVNYSQAGVLAHDGRCRAFDAAADGIARSEGAAVIVLKRLSRALADGDRIYALIAGSAAAQDGRSAGLLAPSSSAQVTMLRRAYANAGLDPSRVRFVEAHGTGTQLGDPIEVRALARVLTRDREPGRRCALGSIKTNLGHLEAAAGIAGLIKAALSIWHGTLPPNLHFQRANPQLELDPERLEIPTVPLPLERGSELVAGVTSLGFGGSIAHVVLRGEPHADASEDATASVQLLPVSGQSPAALAAATQALAHFLQQTDAPPLATICHTARLRRQHHAYRTAVVGSSQHELAQHLSLRAAELSEQAPRAAAGEFRCVWVFPGFGGLSAQMGRELYAQLDVFKQAVLELESTIREECGWSVAELLSDPDASWQQAQLDVSQPLLFCVQYGLAAVWRHWGLEPRAVVGQSMGEITAATVAGILLPTDAARLVCRRAKLLLELTGKGSMLAVNLGVAALLELLRELGHSERAHVAAHLSASSLVLSGEHDALLQVAERLARDGVHHHRFEVTSPGHSPAAECLREPFLRACAFVQPRAATLPMYSTVAGQVGQRVSGDREYWWRNLRQPVAFADTAAQLAADAPDAFLELSPHPVLKAPLAEALAAAGAESTCVSSLRRNTSELPCLLNALSDLYALGAEVRWQALPLPQAAMVSIPHYPWQRRHYWFSDDAASTWQAPSVAMSRPEGIAPRGESAPRPVRPKLSRAALAALPVEAVRAEIAGYLRAHLARALRRLPDEIDEHAQLTSLGLESLMVIELKNVIHRDLHCQLRMAMVFGRTMAQLADDLALELRQTEAIDMAVATREATIPAARPPALETQLDHISDLEVEQQLSILLAHG